MLAAQLKKHPIKAKSKEPLWLGPCDESPRGGITQSMLQRFICCRERFRIRYILGLEPSRGWSKPLGYGDMWHICEEAAAAKKDHMPALIDHMQEMLALYPYERETIEHFATACAMQFPCYKKHWQNHPDQEQREPLEQEKEFHVPYHLPFSDRIVWLRGKRDSVDIIPSGENRGIWLHENKTKGDIQESQLRRQLVFDCQTMFYLTSLYEDKEFRKSTPQAPIRGVRYNVIRRPFSGGKGSIKQHQPTKSNPRGESVDEFFERFKREYLDADPAYWFMRWNAEVSAREVGRFMNEFLNPTLEQLCDWYEWIAKVHGTKQSPYDNPVHFRAPFGVYDPLKETGATEYDSYIESGNEIGLTYRGKLFPELTAV